MLRMFSLALLIAVTAAIAGCSKATTPESSTTPARPAPKQEPKVSFRTEPARPLKGKATKVFLSVSDAAGNAIVDADVKVTFTMEAMPSMNMPEMNEAFSMTRSGTQYTGTVKLGMVGLWNVTAEVNRGGKTIATYRDTVSVQ